LRNKKLVVTHILYFEPIFVRYPFLSADYDKTE